MPTRYFCSSNFDGSESGSERMSEHSKNWYSSRFLAMLAVCATWGTTFLTSTDAAANTPCKPFILSSGDVTPSFVSNLSQPGAARSLDIIVWSGNISLSLLFALICKLEDGTSSIPFWNYRRDLICTPAAFNLINAKMEFI